MSARKLARWIRAASLPALAALALLALAPGAQAAKAKAKPARVSSPKKAKPPKAAPAAKPTPEQPAGPPGAASAEPPASHRSSNPHLEEARRLFMNFEYEHVPAKLEEALGVNGNSLEDKVEIYKLLAMTHLAFEDAARAQEAFLKLLELKPDYELLGMAAPKVRTTFAQAQKVFEARQAVKLAHEPPKIAAAGTTTSVDVVVVAGASRIGAMTLHYRPEGAQGGFSQLPMTRGTKGAHSAPVPNVFPGPAGLRTVEYFVRARDASGALVAAIGDERSPLRMKIETVEAPGKPLLKNPLFWTAVGVGVASAIAVPLLLTDDANVPPGNLGLERLP